GPDAKLTAPRQAVEAAQAEVTRLATQREQASAALAAAEARMAEIGRAIAEAESRLQSLPVPPAN
uniref:hypothetical protein n=1 Tax=Falsiroseomonas oryziterrae TaxID=2911368 RepID=UPI001F33C949